MVLKIFKCKRKLCINEVKQLVVMSERLLNAAAVSLNFKLTAAATWKQKTFKYLLF